jgi:hypothetical protein
MRAVAAPDGAGCTDSYDRLYRAVHAGHSLAAQSRESTRGMRFAHAFEKTASSKLTAGSGSWRGWMPDGGDPGMMDSGPRFMIDGAAPSAGGWPMMDGGQQHRAEPRLAARGTTT